MTMALPASSIVAGRALPTRPATERRRWMDWPKSPCSTWPSQIAYCTGRGRSSPIVWRIASISALVALGGMDMAAGSTGSRRSAMNMRAETTRSVGSATAARQARVRSMPGTSRTAVSCQRPSCVSRAYVQ